MDAGLVPVKSLATAKRRLEARFAESERRAIAEALLDDALVLCTEVTELRWWVVTADHTVRRAAAERGLEVVSDPGAGLNAALAEGVAAVRAAGAASITIIPCDVPLATAEDLHDIVDTGETSDVVVVPAVRDGGTNALHLRPPDLLEPRFGPHSLAAHAGDARRRALRCSILPLERLALDIDHPEDVDDFLGRAPRGRTAEVLARLAR